MHNIQNSYINSNLSYLTFKSEDLKNINFSHSLFNGTIINETKILDCNLNNSDLEGCIIKNSSFKNTQMNNCDIKSLIISNSKFINVSFDDASLLNCKFSNVVFNKCNFSSTFIQENRFENCVFENISFNHCSAFFNDFFESIFNTTTIKNNIYYSIFNNCYFKNSVLEAYLIGYSYGLTNENFQELRFLINGVETNEKIESIINKVEKMYTDRLMFLNVGFMQLNLNIIEKNYALCICIDFINKCIEKNIVIKNETIKFMSLLVEILYKQNDVAPYTLIYLYSALSMIIKKCKNDFETYTIYSELNILQNKLYFLYQEFMDKLNCKEYKIAKNSEIMLHIVYKEKPETDLINILTFANNSNIPVELIRTEKGSFLEWIKCGDNLINFISVFLEILGIAIPIIYDKHKNKKETDKKHSDETNKITIHSDKTKIEMIVPTQQNISITTSNLKTVIQVMDECEINPKNNFKGYNKQNIKKIEINILN